MIVVTNRIPVTKGHEIDFDRSLRLIDRRAPLRSPRGPSNSQKKIPCHVESPSTPSITGIVSEGPTKPALRCASPLPSWRSCNQTPGGMSLRSQSFETPEVCVAADRRHSVGARSMTRSILVRVVASSACGT